MNGGNDGLYLRRILKSIDAIEGHVAGYDFKRFAGDLKTYDAVLMQFVNIGEMINRLSDAFREEYSYLTWHAAIGMRNQIAHGYDSVKPEAVWETITDDLSHLKADIDKILSTSG